MGIIMLNDESYGGGDSGGNAITYGYAEPTGSANDGDTYFLLNNQNKKKGSYLYMTNAWALIEGKRPGTQYLPESDATKILCEATLANFDNTSLSWGDGSSPMTLTANVDLQDDEAVYIPAQASGVRAYVDLGETNHPFTAYVVAKVVNPGSYARIISCMSNRGGGAGIMLYGSTVNISSWVNDTSTGISSSANYFVGVIQFVAPQVAYGKVNNSALISKPPTSCGRYVALGNTDQQASANEPCNILIKYLGVVDDVDSTADIADNVANLMTIFGIS